ncbi:MAG: glutathione S-transferase N-terminal domain-containing protein, partial [Comamonas sp.]
MQLFLNASSPFARLARVVALEKGLADQLQLVWCDPWNNDPALLAEHPQARIPVLVTDDGQAISESLLIAQYLDHIGHGKSLVPAAQMSAILARTSVAYGLMEAAFNVVIARKYEGQAADSSMMGQRRLAAMGRALAQLEKSVSTPMDAQITLDQIATAVALAYVQFRLPALLPQAD